MAVANRIIVVDDEPDLRDMIAEYLSQKGYAVRVANGGATLDVLLAAQPADLVLLDVTMPGEDGLAIARRLSDDESAPAIIMVTAAGEVADKVVGLEIGADDYITKPFDLRELLARVRAVLRRREALLAARRTAAEAAFPTGRTASGTASAAAGDGDRKVRFGTAVLDLDARRLVRDDGTEITLTAMEYDLLHAFATHPNRVLTRDQLLDLAHNRNWDPFDRSIDVRIARLRRKIEPEPAKPQVIKTVRGVGYLFARDLQSFDPGI